MEESEFAAGCYLYKIYDPNKINNKESQRVFIHTGYTTADGYGVLLGFTTDGVLCKSSGHGNYQFGGNVRYATYKEIEEFIKEVLRYQEPIKAY